MGKRYDGWRLRRYWATQARRKAWLRPSYRAALMLDREGRYS